MMQRLLCAHKELCASTLTMKRTVWCSLALPQRDGGHECLESAARREALRRLARARCRRHCRRRRCVFRDCRRRQRCSTLLSALASPALPLLQLWKQVALHTACTAAQAGVWRRRGAACGYRRSAEPRHKQRGARKRAH